MTANPEAHSEHPPAQLPEQLFDDAAAESRWRSRLTAVRMSLPQPSRDDPNRAVYLSNESGAFELVTWDAQSGQSVQATDRSDGTTIGMLSADGRSLWWFDDTRGDEFGSWRHQPFGSSPGSADAAMQGVPPGYPAGVEVGRTLAMAGFGDDDGTRIHLANAQGIRTVYEHHTDGALAALSPDETIWVLSHSEHGDSRYPALRAYSVANNVVLHELDDTPGKGVDALEFSPVPGDQRVLVGHERRGRDELGIWDLATGELTELDLDFPGDLDAAFYPDGRSLLVIHTHHARSTVHRYNLASGVLTDLPTEDGVITSALARPDGSVWYRHSNAATGWTLRVLPATNEDDNEHDGVQEAGSLPANDAEPEDDSDDASPETIPATFRASEILIAAPDGGAAPSEPVTDIWVDGPGGPIHALLARPAGSPPVAEPGHANTPIRTVFLVHGGPAAADDDSFDALRATYLDAGIAVCQVNYRGSTGYGAAWRDALAKRIGHTELVDIAAVQDYLLTNGLVAADQCAIAGHSWGGFLTLLALGAQSSRWTVGVAGVPVADYVAAYTDEMEPMRAYDRSLFGGSPDEKPLSYSDSSPLTWIDELVAPVLILAGENDPRCPIRQIENYLGALKARHSDYAVYRFNAGHGSMVVDERIRQVACEVAYIRDRLLA